MVKNGKNVRFKKKKNLVGTMGLSWLPYGQKEIFDQIFFEFFSSSKHIIIYQKFLFNIFEKEMIDLIWRKNYHDQL